MSTTTRLGRGLSRRLAVADRRAERVGHPMSYRMIVVHDPG